MELKRKGLDAGQQRKNPTTSKNERGVFGIRMV
jgi:hypothetical protein